MLIQKITATKEDAWRWPTWQIKEVNQYCLKSYRLSLQAIKSHYHGIAKGQEVMKDPQKQKKNIFRSLPKRTSNTESKKQK